MKNYFEENENQKRSPDEKKTRMKTVWTKITRWEKLNEKNPFKKMRKRRNPNEKIWDENTRKRSTLKNLGEKNLCKKGCDWKNLIQRTGTRKIRIKKKKKQESKKIKKNNEKIGT